MTTIAVDAMGGDHAPKSEVEGAIAATRDLAVKVILVGVEDVVRKELARHRGASELPIEVVLDELGAYAAARTLAPYANILFQAAQAQRNKALRDRQRAETLVV